MRPLFVCKKPKPYSYRSRDSITRNECDSTIYLKFLDGVHEIRVTKNWDVVSDKQDASDEEAQAVHIEIWHIK